MQVTVRQAACKWRPSWAHLVFTCEEPKPITLVLLVLAYVGGLVLLAHIHLALPDALLQATGPVPCWQGHSQMKLQLWHRQATTQTLTPNSYTIIEVPCLGQILASAMPEGSLIA